MLPIKTLLKSGGAASVWTVEPSDTVLDALRILAERDIGIVPVVQAGKLVGIFRERDYARRVILLGRSSATTTIAEVMTENVRTADVEDGVEECMKVVVENGFRHLPIMDDGELVGVVSANDLLAEVIRSRELKIGQLESYIWGTGEIT